MKGSKQLAKEMAKVINIENDSFFTGFINGVINIPVDLFYLGYDFLNTEYRSENNHDKYRMALLFKSGLANTDSLIKIIKLALGEYVDKLSDEQKQNFLKAQSGKIVGGLLQNNL